MISTIKDLFGTQQIDNITLVFACIIYFAFTMGVCNYILGTIRQYKLKVISKVEAIATILLVIIVALGFYWLMSKVN